MKTHYLVVARRTIKADKAVLASLLKKLSAKVEFDCGWKFKSGERYSKLGSQIFVALNSKFAFCFIAAPEKGAVEFYSNYPYRKSFYHRLPDIHKQDWESVLEVAAKSLLRQEEKIRKMDENPKSQ